MMKNKSIWLIGILLVLVVIVYALIFAERAKAPGNPPAQGSGPTDPQMLLIPRWFLREMTVDGKSFNLPEQGMTLQFEENGQANGQGGCNSFGSSYTASKDGKMSFGPIMSTEMACIEGDAMERESAYLQGLAKVQQYSVEVGKLTLSSADGKVLLVFGMPPK